MKTGRTSWMKWIVLGGIGTIIFVLMVITVHDYLTEPFPGHADFYSRWEGARSFWIDGLNPYGAEASLNIHMGFYGRPALPEEDQVLFAYPMYTAILIAPLVLVDFAWAAAIIMVTMMALSIMALFMLFDLFKFRPNLIQMVFLGVFALLHYTISRGFILGQLGFISYVMYVITFWGLHKERDTLAAVALAIATIKPQLGFLIVPFLLLWGLRAQRWQFVGAFIVSMLVLVGVSFVLVPTWLFDMWGQVTAYTEYAPPIPSDVLFEDILGLPANAKYIMFAGLWGLMLFGWYQVLVDKQLDRAMWVAVITLAVTNIASPVIATPHFAVFMIPLIFYMKLLSRRPAHRRWSLALLAIIFIGSWVLFATTVDRETTLESWIMAYPEPILVLVSLWFTRHEWWERGAVLQPASESKLTT
ncbi:MAG: glycosyltransferase family 87 protein [Chloroflexota bacterium]